MGDDYDFDIWRISIDVWVDSYERFTTSDHQRWRLLLTVKLCNIGGGILRRTTCLDIDKIGIRGARPCTGRMSRAPASGVWCACVSKTKSTRVLARIAAGCHCHFK